MWEGGREQERGREGEGCSVLAGCEHPLVKDSFSHMAAVGTPDGNKTRRGKKD